MLNKADLLPGMTKEMIENMLHTPDISHIPELSHLITRFVNQIEANKKYQAGVGFSEDKPFTTIVHSDFWVNNVMISHGNISNKCVQYKLQLFINFRFRGKASKC